jgi:hypothetical protein
MPGQIAGAMQRAAASRATRASLRRQSSHRPAFLTGRSYRSIARVTRLSEPSKAPPRPLRLRKRRPLVVFAGVSARITTGGPMLGRSRGSAFVGVTGALRDRKTSFYGR